VNRKDKIVNLEFKNRPAENKRACDVSKEIGAKISFSCEKESYVYFMGQYKF
jgi:hypothetical protein